MYVCIVKSVREKSQTIIFNDRQAAKGRNSERVAFRLLDGFDSLRGLAAYI